MELFVDTYGAYLHVKDQLFEIKTTQNGEPVKHTFAAAKVSSIRLGTGTALSSEAVRLAITHNIDILFVERDGSPIGRVWHSKLGSTTKIRKSQLVCSMNSRGVEVVKDFVGRKVRNQIDFLKDLKRHREQKADYLDERIDRLENLSASIQLLEGQTVSEIAETIRGLEGTAGRIYFEVLSKLLAKSYQFDGRSSRPAKDPFNAFLNYAYGILYGKIEKALIIAGLDPYLGFLHRDDYNQLSFVFDFIEPYRIHADIVVFRLFAAKKINAAHTDNITNGMSLNKEGKALLINTFTDYMENEKIRYKGRNQSRANTIQLDAHTFANSLISTP